MKCVIAYDIESDAVRTRIAEYLLTVGERVQKSVFECRVTPEECEEIIVRLREELGATNGGVRVYRLCESCWEASSGIGTVTETADAKPCLIL